MAREREKFEAAVKALIKKAQKAEDRQVVKAIRLLDEARKAVAASVATTDWQTYSLPLHQAAIERALNEFARQYGMDLRTAQGEFWTAGVGMIDGPLLAAGVSAVVPAIDTSALVALQDYSRHLVDSLGRDAAARIYNELSLGMIGQKTPFEVMQAVGRNLKDPGIFHSIAARAETITRTECGRALAKASQVRLEAAAEVVPGLKKVWVYGTAPRKHPRISHVAVDGQVRDVDKPFSVAGEALMFPRDPAGSARNTINCSCYSAPWRDEWASGDEKQAVAA